MIAMKFYTKKGKKFLGICTQVDLSIFFSKSIKASIKPSIFLETPKVKYYFSKKLRVIFFILQRVISSKNWLILSIWQKFGKFEFGMSKILKFYFFLVSFKYSIKFLKDQYIRVVLDPQIL